MEWFKKNWKTVLLVLLCLMWMSQCTKSCTRNTVIASQTVQIDSLQNIVNTQSAEIMQYKADIEWMERNKADISNVATGNQNQYIEKVTALNKENAALKRQVKLLKADTTALNEAVRKFQAERGF